jgi:signal transduction histidine kinase
MIALELGGWLAASAGAVAAAGARRALAGRMESIARACHELRGPLAAARLGLEGGAGNGALTPDRLRAIDLELGRAALVLDDLDAVRTRRAWPRLPEMVDLERLVADSVEAWRATAVAHGVELRASWSGDAQTVWGDRLRLAQVTGNLIANAIEHGGGVVEVHGHADRTRARVEVTDTGPGLPAPVAELVRAGGDGRGGWAGRGRRGGPGRRGSRGTRGGRGRRGRGLAIAAAIADEQGGRLAAAPSVRGARLVLELPAGRPPAELVPAGRGRVVGRAPARRGPAGLGPAGKLPGGGGEGAEPPRSPA